MSVKKQYREEREAELEVAEVAEAELEVAEAKLFLAKNAAMSVKERYTEESEAKKSNPIINWNERDENGWGVRSNLSPWD